MLSVQNKAAPGKRLRFSSFHEAAMQLFRYLPRLQYPNRLSDGSYTFPNYRMRRFSVLLLHAGRDGWLHNRMPSANSTSAPNNNLPLYKPSHLRVPGFWCSFRLSCPSGKAGHRCIAYPILLQKECRFYQKPL